MGILDKVFKKAEDLTSAAHKTPNSAPRTHHSDPAPKASPADSAAPRMDFVADNIHPITKDAAQRMGLLNLTSDERQKHFTIAMVSLCAKIAKSHGRVTPAKIAAFQAMVTFPREDVQALGRLFDRARSTSEGYETYARQIAALYLHNNIVLSRVMETLCVIARADGPLQRIDHQMINTIGIIFDYRPPTIEKFKTYRRNFKFDNPYKVLGVRPDMDVGTIKSRWRQLNRENHPDLLRAKGLPREFADRATDHLAAINAAFDKIARQRGMR
jgi:DnaJ like chaperone protein